MKIRLLFVLFCICILFSACNNATKNENSNINSKVNNISSAVISSKVNSSSISSVAVSSSLDEVNKIIYQAKENYYATKYNEAIKLCDSALELDQNSYEAYTVKGISLSRLYRLTEGEKLLKKALEIKSDYTYGIYSMAMYYKIKGDKDKCLEWFYKALETDENDVWSIYGAATIYADRYEVDKALEMLERSIKLEPEIKKIAQQQYALHWEKFRNNEKFIELVN